MIKRELSDICVFDDRVEVVRMLVHTNPLFSWRELDIGIHL